MNRCEDLSEIINYRFLVMNLFVDGKLIARFVNLSLLNRAINFLKMSIPLCVLNTMTISMENLQAANFLNLHIAFDKCIEIKAFKIVTGKLVICSKPYLYTFFAEYLNGYLLNRC